MVLCVAMLPHDTVLVSVPEAGALGGGDGAPAEAYNPADMREGVPMPPGTRKTPLSVEEMEKKVDDMVNGLEKQVRPLVELLRGFGCKLDYRLPQLRAVVRALPASYLLRCCFT